MSNAKVLIVEDDIALAGVMVKYLDKNGYDAGTVATGADLFKKADSETFDCLVIDLTLPDEDGIVLVRKMRARSQVPIIVMTGRQQIEDKMACFELGADDYVVKPVDPRELDMRIQAVIRRATGESGAGQRVKLGSLELDHARHTVINEYGDAVDLTPAEFSMLWVLATSDGKVLSREDLVDAISSGDGPLSFRAVDILVSRLRKKIDKGLIETVPLVGYKCAWETVRD